MWRGVSGTAMAVWFGLTGGPTIVKIKAMTALHRWELPVLHYHEIMVLYPYYFLVVITQLFTWIIFIHDCVCILTGSPG